MSKAISRARISRTVGIGAGVAGMTGSFPCPLASAKCPAAGRAATAQARISRLSPAAGLRHSGLITTQPECPQMRLCPALALAAFVSFAALPTRAGRGAEPCAGGRRDAWRGPGAGAGRQLYAMGRDARRSADPADRRFGWPGRSTSAPRPVGTGPASPPEAKCPGPRPAARSGFRGGAGAGPPDGRGRPGAGRCGRRY